MTAVEARPASSDEFLFLAFAVDRNPHALGELFRRRAPELLRLATRCASRADAEDLVQATFVTAMRDSAAFDGRRRVMPWLCGILKNHAKHARRQRRRGLPATADRFANDPTDALVKQEIRAALQRGLANVGTPYREVLDLHLHHDLDSREIARVLGRTPVAVRKQLSRAYGLLRAAFPIGLALGATIRVAPSQRTIAAWHATRQSAGADLVRARLGRRVTFAGLAAAAAVTVVALTIEPEFASSSSEAASVGSAAPVEARGAHASLEPAGVVELGTSPAPLRTAADRATIRVAVARRDGSPAAGVRLRASPAGELPPAMRSLSASFAVTADDGVATFEVPSGGWFVAPIEVTPLRRVDAVASATTDLALVVDGPFVVRGEVADAARRPVAGASVFVSDSGGRLDDGVEVATTDADGEFSFVASLPEPKVFARARGHAASECQRARDRAPVALQLLGPARELSVLVVDEHGAAIPEAFVAAVPSQRDLQQIPLAHRRTDAAGLAVVDDFPVTGGAVVVRCEGLAPLLLAGPSGDGALRLTARLQRGAELYGQVARPDGEAGTPNVYATLGSVPIDTPVTQLLQVWCPVADDGSWRLAGLPVGDLVVRVLCEHRLEAMRRQGMPRQLGATTVQVEPGTRRRLDLELRRTTATVGRAVTTEGPPLADWTIVATERNLAGSPLAGNLAITARSGADGTFLLAGLAHDVDYDVAGYPPGMRAGDPDWLPAVVVRHRAGDALVLTTPPHLAAATLRVHLDGPVDEVALLRSGTRQRVALARTHDGAGTFAVTGTFSGDHLVEVVDRAHGRRLVPITLTPGRSADLAVPAPLPPATVAVVAGPAHRRFHARLLDEHGVEHARASGSGRLALGHVAPGRYRLQTYGRTLAATVRDVHLASGERSIAVDAPATATSEIVFPFDPRENPLSTVPSLVVSLRDEAGQLLLSESLRANDVGAFRVAVALAPGRYVCDAVTSWGSRARLPLVVDDDAPRFAQCDLALPE